MQTLPPSARVRAKPEFDRVFEHGRRLSSPLLGLHWLGDDAPARLGLAVSRKVDPRAVGRNRIKRILRAQFRLQRSALVPGAYVVIARAAAANAPPAALREAFLGLLRRAGALPASLPAQEPDGTMPAAAPSARIPSP